MYYTFQMINRLVPHNRQSLYDIGVGTMGALGAGAPLYFLTVTHS